MIAKRLLLLICVLCALIGTASAHELRPAFLQLNELERNHFDVLWRVPLVGNRRLPLDVELPEGCTATGDRRAVMEIGGISERWSIDCPAGLKGQMIAVAGLRSTLFDVLTRVAYQDGATETFRLTPENPAFMVRGPHGFVDVVKVYFVLGVEHILGGFDHLLFLLALMLMIQNRWMLIKAVTAFTAAHSLTLGGAALGFLWLPQKPVEACIALSIVFVAAELLKRPATEPGWLGRNPWFIAFLFGLLHGFGFAGALKEIGLPQNGVTLALLSFNLGVEAGQLLFIGMIILLTACLNALISLPVKAGRAISAYAIGGVASAWLIARLLSFGA
jgi:hypothetical protein